MQPPSPTELSALAKEAAQAGGAELLRWRGRFQAREKGPSDFVTDADIASQEAIRRVIAARFPQHAFVGEESTPAGGPSVDDAEVCWVVDPLDGTTNYLHDFPSFAVSVAAVVQGRPVAGVILDPIRDEMFWAAAGGGAWLADDAISTSSATRLSDALVAMSLPASVGSDSPDLIDFVRVAPSCQAVRRIGSAALNLAYLACGRLDAYWAREINAWDIAAGVLLVEEAGGVVTGDAGSEFDLWRPPCIASCGKDLHNELLNQLAARA